MKPCLRSCMFVLFGFSWVALAPCQEPAPSKPTPAEQPSEGKEESPEEQEDSHDAGQPAEDEGLEFGSGMGMGGGMGAPEDSRSVEELPEVEPVPTQGGMVTVQKHPNQVEYEGLRFKFPSETVTALNQLAIEAEESNRPEPAWQERSTSEPLPERVSYESEIESRLSPVQLRKLTELRFQRVERQLRQAQLEMLLYSTLLKIQGSEQISFEEGVARWTPREELEKLREEGLLTNVSGNQLYSEPLAPAEELRAQFLAICLNPNSYEEYGGGKMCGGFHADIGIQACNSSDAPWETPARILLCFGCQEAQVIDHGSSLKFDLKTDAAIRLEKLASQLYRHRTAKSKE